MKILKLSLVFFIIQLFCLHQINAENLNAVRVIVNGEIITEFDIQTRAYEAFRLASQKYTEAGLESKKQEIIQNAIDITEIEDLVNYKCMELSDGQLQRVMIARALAQDTPLILLDEPTTHLDIYHRAYLLKLLKKLAVEKQKTILFSTQEIDLAIQVSNKMIVMTKDKVHFDQPNKLIELGCFNTLFPSETIEFNKDLKRFILKD